MDGAGAVRALLVPITQSMQFGIDTGFILSGGNGHYLVWHKTGLVQTEYTQTDTNWNVFLAHSNHVPAALCTIKLQCFGAVFSVLKYSCVLPNIIPAEELSSSY